MLRLDREAQWIEEGTSGGGISPLLYTSGFGNLLSFERWLPDRP